MNSADRLIGILDSKNILSLELERADLRKRRQLNKLTICRDRQKSFELSLDEIFGWRSHRRSRMSEL
jgi:hypothetical protein